MRRSFTIMRHVRGSGLEVGAAAGPSLIPIGAEVRYVDKYPPERLLGWEPELKGHLLQPPDILAEAETLEPVADDSQDFVLAFVVLSTFRMRWRHPFIG